uniref:Acid-sensing ion channel 2 n=1 Tax=Phallusia mammillata TaxID=59560 RepID=A0A6F9D7H8_9ASCI|nr:acid-sensing ion channel 2 [Phallusia mammillata]
MEPTGDRFTIESEKSLYVDMPPYEGSSTFPRLTNHVREKQQQTRRTDTTRPSSYSMEPFYVSNVPPDEKIRLDQPKSPSREAELSQNSSNQDEDRQPKPSDFTFFAANSTLHGINHIFTNGRFTFRKALWAIAFTSSLFLFLYQAYDRYSYYSTRPHVTKLDEEEATEIDFPALTICNMNSFRLSVVSTDDYFYTGEHIFRLFNPDFTLKQRQFRDNRTWPIVKRKISEILRLRKRYTPTATTFNMSEFYDRTGHQVQDMVKSCKYRGRDCMSYKDWTTVFTRYGKCYTFNSGQKYSPLKTLKGGIDNGLELLLDTQQNDYMPVWDETDEISVEAGFKVQLHVQSEPPFIHELGFGIAPGFQSLVATQEQRITFLPEPWGNCVQDFDKSVHSHFKNYSISGCRITCETKFVFDNCNCRMVHMPGDAPFCTPEQYKECADPALDYLVKVDDKICVCETPCEVTRYNLETSNLRLPSTQALSYLAYKYRKTEDYVKDNFVKLNIFFEALNYETIEQKVAYEIPGLFGDIGGQMGLFIGASILTLLELFNYLYEVVKDKTWGKKLRKARRHAANESLRRELQNQRDLNNGYKMVNQEEPHEERRNHLNNDKNALSDRQTPGAYSNKLSPLQEFNTNNFETFSASDLPPPPAEYTKPAANPNNEAPQLSRRTARGARETSHSYSDLYRTPDREWQSDEAKQRFAFPGQTTAADSGFCGSSYLSSQYQPQRVGEVPLTPLSLLTNPSMLTSPVHQYDASPSVETDIH